MKKYILFFIILISGIVAAGCAESPKENVAPAQESVSVRQAAVTEPQSQDTLWIDHLQKYIPLLQADFDNIALAAQNKNYDSLNTFGQNILDDTRNALNESQSYIVSSKYTDAKTEWESALREYNYAGRYIILIADSGENGKNNAIYIQEFQNCSNSGMGHLNRATAFIKGANAQ